MARRKRSWEKMTFSKTVKDGKGNAVKSGTGSAVKSRGIPKTKVTPSRGAGSHQSSGPSTRPNNRPKTKSMSRGPSRRPNNNPNSKTVSAGPSKRYNNNPNKSALQKGPSQRLGPRRGASMSTGQPTRDGKRRLANFGVGPTKRAIVLGRNQNNNMVQNRVRAGKPKDSKRKRVAVRNLKARKQNPSGYRGSIWGK